MGQHRGTGQICWLELQASNDRHALPFYEQLFGWTHEVDPSPGTAGDYHRLYCRGEAIGGLFRLATATGERPGWQVYFATDDAEATAARARAAGGEVLYGPLAVGDAGRLVTMREPSGAVVSAWEAGTHRGITTERGHGAFAWAELNSRSLTEAEAFFEAVAGWTFADSANGTAAFPYREFAVGGEPAQGGALQMTEEWGDLPSHWMVYFEVDDTDAAVARARTLGGSVCFEPFTIGGVGRAAILADPTGAAFFVIRMAETSSP